MRCNTHRLKASAAHCFRTKCIVRTQEFHGALKGQGERERERVQRVQLAADWFFPYIPTRSCPVYSWEAKIDFDL